MVQTIECETLFQTFPLLSFLTIKRSSDDGFDVRDKIEKRPTTSSIFDGKLLRSKFSDGFTCVDSFFASVATGGAAASSTTVGSSRAAGFDIGCFVVLGFLFFSSGP
ncbi:hypothetical protein IC582_008998 [Cucumis melo]|uniref:Uncharacterized protein n=2 Tax=Cucumis melo TaxID=3656 RepID=A0A5D3DPE0_CUCMM|nr:uncharacterized protein LOC103486890 [Cucumis melo]KAA0053878.1 uncharacterized protein E6C27_scaffold135G002710 [Cucumis melo var. makuwa]TYK25526.1 uncharacterized protein E5676_scaffold352G006780 [Cucumis melo var. makuwa]